MLVITLHIRQERPFTGADRNILSGQQPRGQAAELPLCTDIRRRANNGVKSDLLRRFQKCGNIKIALETVFTRLRLVEIPRHIRFHGIAAHRPQLFQPVTPIRTRHAEIVDRAGDDPERFAVQIKLIFDRKGVHRSSFQVSAYRSRSSALLRADDLREAKSLIAYSSESAML